MENLQLSPFIKCVFFPNHNSPPSIFFKPNAAKLKWNTTLDIIKKFSYTKKWAWPHVSTNIGCFLYMLVCFNNLFIYFSFILSYIISCYLFVFYSLLFLPVLSFSFSSCLPTFTLSYGIHFLLTLTCLG